MAKGSIHVHCGRSKIIWVDKGVGGVVWVISKTLKNIASNHLTCGHFIVSMLPTCCFQAVSMLPACYKHVVSMCRVCAMLQKIANKPFLSGSED